MNRFRDPYGAEIKNGFSVLGYRDPYGVIVSSTTAVALIHPPRNAWAGYRHRQTVHCSLKNYSLFAIGYSLHTIHYSLFTVYYSLFTIY